MDAIFGLLVAGGVASIVGLLTRFRFRERSEAWQRAAQAAGLTDVQVSSFMAWETRLTGMAGPLRVRVESYQHGKNERGTRIAVEGLRHGAYALTIRPEGIATALEKTFGERETVVGDEAFDRAAYLQGAPALIRALFDADTRRRMQRLLEGTLRADGPAGPKDLGVRAGVSDNELRVEIREPLFGGVAPYLPAALVMVLELGRRLARPDDLAAAVAANNRREPVPAVRLANLQLLAREYASHAATRDTLLAALADEDPAVRLQAAIAVGPEGRVVLLETATQEGVEDELAAKAIVALGEEFPVSQAIERLQRARDSDHPALPRACINVIGRTRTAEAVEALAGVLAEGREELAVDAASGLGAAPGERAEGALVAALGQEAAAVRIAAAEALGRIGTPRAVAPLRECAGAHAFDGALRRAARQAIAEIQARVTGASPGQLSLAAGDTGQVSLVEEDRRGQVSLEPGSQESGAAGPRQPQETDGSAQ